MQRLHGWVGEGEEDDEPTRRIPEICKLRLLRVSKGSRLFAGDYPIMNVAFNELPSICARAVDFRTHSYYYERWGFKIDKLLRKVRKSCEYIPDEQNHVAIFHSFHVSLSLSHLTNSSLRT